MKTCSKCAEVKPLEAFNRYRRSKDGMQSYCRACQTKIRTEYYYANRAEELRRNAAYLAKNRERASARHAVNLLRRYGLTEDSYAALVAAQEGACAICKTTEPGGRGRWHVDHDHSCCDWQASSKALCGRCTRGLLCHYCNLMIGTARDEVETLQRAIDYLRRPPAPEVLDPVL